MSIPPFTPTYHHLIRRVITTSRLRFFKGCLTFPPMNSPSKMQVAIAAAGGSVALAGALGITSQAISQWSRVPQDRVLDVVRSSNFAVTAYDLRPDLLWTEMYKKKHP